MFSLSGAGEEGKWLNFPPLQSLMGKEIEKPTLELPEGIRVVVLEGSRLNYGDKFLGKGGKRRRGELLRVIKPESLPGYEACWGMVRLDDGPIINFRLENIAIAPSVQEESSS